jgi:RecB family exonuclease
MAFGNSLHAVLDALHKGPDEHSDVSTQADRVADLLSLHWRGKGYADKETEDAAFLEASSVLKYYVRSPHVPSGTLLGTELYLSCHATIAHRKVELSARIDRLELHPEGLLEALDYKTNRDGQVPSASTLASDLPSFIYFLVVWHHYSSDPRVLNVALSQLNLMSLSKTRVQYDQRHIVAHKAALIDVVASITAEEFQPRVNKSCAWCPVRESCPAWGELNLDDLTDSGVRST